MHRVYQLNQVTDTLELSCSTTYSLQTGSFCNHDYNPDKETWSVPCTHAPLASTNPMHCQKSGWEKGVYILSQSGSVACCCQPSILNMFTGWNSSKIINLIRVLLLLHCSTGRGDYLPLLSIVEKSVYDLTIPQEGKPELAEQKYLSFSR